MLTISKEPVSRKRTKKTLTGKTRNKFRPTPYVRPVLPTPSSPSDAEFSMMNEGGMDLIDLPHPEREYTEVSTSEEKFEHSMAKEDTSHIRKRYEESTIMYTREKFESSTPILASHDEMQIIESEELGFEPISPMELTMKEETPNRESKGFPTNANIECLTPTEFITKESTPRKNDILNEKITPFTSQEIKSLASEFEFSEEISEETLLKYGDLVVVEYTEKEKLHKWPAIVNVL